ncbi:MAG: hypothetical protein Q4D81_11280 [Eubacteriales bacterium]|nr:hypothetical protein [Eubacteriales bacterium]
MDSLTGPAEQTDKQTDYTGRPVSAGTIGGKYIVHAESLKWGAAALRQSPCFFVF